MKDKKIQEKEKINLKLLNKRRQRLKEKGITLIALVVTIIILLILAGVTLNMAMSGGGLFSRARNTADKYKKAQEDEAELISEIGKEMNSEYVGAYIEGYKTTGGECTITGDQSGTGSNQEFKTENEKKDGNELKWRIWDYDGTTLRITLLDDSIAFTVGLMLSGSPQFKCFSKFDLYSCRLYTKVLNDEDIRINYQESINYHNYLTNNKG